MYQVYFNFQIKDKENFFAADADCVRMLFSTAKISGKNLLNL